MRIRHWMGRSITLPPDSANLPLGCLVEALSKDYDVMVAHVVINAKRDVTEIVIHLDDKGRHFATR